MINLFSRMVWIMLNLKKTIVVLSDQSEYEDEIPQHSENDANHEVVNSNKHQDNGDINHDVEDSTHQHPLSCDSEMDHDGQEDECVDGDLPFCGLDDNSLVEEMRDISQQQVKPTIQNANYHKFKKSLERERYVQESYSIIYLG